MNHFISSESIFLFVSLKCASKNMTRIRPEINGEKRKSILFSLTMRRELLIYTRHVSVYSQFFASLQSIMLENFIRLARLNQLPNIISGSFSFVCSCEKVREIRQRFHSFTFSSSVVLLTAPTLKTAN